MVTDEAFKAAFFKEATDLGKIKLAICEKRYTIIQRRDKPNLPEVYLQAVLLLPAGYPVKKAPRQSKRPGSNHVFILTFPCPLFGKTVQVYLKCYFAHENFAGLELEIQSLRNDEEG